MMGQFDIDPMGNKDWREALHVVGLSTYFLMDTLTRAMAISAVAHAYGGGALFAWWLAFVAVDLVSKSIRNKPLKKQQEYDDDDDKVTVTANHFNSRCVAFPHLVSTALRHSGSNHAHFSTLRCS